MHKMYKLGNKFAEVDEIKSQITLFDTSQISTSNPIIL